MILKPVETSTSDCQPGLKILLFLFYESYEISRCRNQNLEITTKATKFLGDVEDYYKIRNSWVNKPHKSRISKQTFSKFLAVLGLPKILAILEGSEQIFPGKRSLGAPVELTEQKLRS